MFGVSGKMILRRSILDMSFVRISIGSAQVEERKWYLVWGGGAEMGFRPLSFNYFPRSLAVKMLCHLELSQNR